MTNNTASNNAEDNLNIYMPGYGDYVENIYNVVANNLNSSSYDYDTSKEAEKDNAYIIFLYPEEARQIKELVKKALDKLDYEGSEIYNEYPDKTGLQNVLNQLYQHLNENMLSNTTSTPYNDMNSQPPNTSTPTPTMPSQPTTMPNTAPLSSDNISNMQYPPSHPTSPPCRGYDCKPPYYPPSKFPDGKPNWLRQLLESIFFDEMVNRRRIYFNNLYR